MTVFIKGISPLLSNFIPKPGTGSCVPQDPAIDYDIAGGDPMGTPLMVKKGAESMDWPTVLKGRLCLTGETGAGEGPAEDEQAQGKGPAPGDSALLFCPAKS